MSRILHRSESEIIRILFREGRPLSIHEIASLTGMSWVTAKKYLAMCRQKGIIETEKGLFELNKNLIHIYDIFEHHGKLYGAFEDGVMIGIGVLDSRFIGSNTDQLQLYFLHVSMDFRKRGIGREIFQLAIQEAFEVGAKKIYISATPSKSTVDFYMNLGCILATEIDKKLFELEPEDIHLEYVL